MNLQPIPLKPEDVSILVNCSLHYHFLQQKSTLPASPSPEETVGKLAHQLIQQLHAAGGPARRSLDDCLKNVTHPSVRRMIENYYYRLEQDWSGMIAANEMMSLRISIAGVSLALRATIDRLDQTSDGGVLAILLRTEQEASSTADALRQNPATTIYHALVASTYPLKRPVRIQELWLYHNQAVTIELSEEEYRQNLGRLREPAQGLARREVMARPGLHCDVCPFKHHGCPVYAQDSTDETEANDFVSPTSDGKISPRKWVFKI